MWIIWVLLFFCSWFFWELLGVGVVGKWDQYSVFSRVPVKCRIFCHLGVRILIYPHTISFYTARGCKTANFIQLLKEIWIKCVKTATQPENLIWWVIAGWNVCSPWHFLGLHFSLWLWFDCQRKCIKLIIKLLSLEVWWLVWYFLPRLYAPVKLFCPHPPPGHPRGHHFFCCCPGVLTTLIFTCPALYKHPNHPFFECPALFYHTHIFSDPGAARGGNGGRTIWPARKSNLQ